MQHDVHLTKRDSIGIKGASPLTMVRGFGMASVGSTFKSTKIQGISNMASELYGKLIHLAQ